MATGSYQFDRFTLDVGSRALRCDGALVNISGRYLDALILLVCENGRLVTKDRFHEEVWRGVPVTDEALTQCIKTLRRQLGDDAARPRLIATVPKHGYRFIAAVELVRDSGVGSTPPHLAERGVSLASSWRDFFLVGGAGTLGSGVAGLAGGLFYGAILSSQQSQEGAGGISMLFVLLWLTMVAAFVGGAGVSFGIAAAGFFRSPAMIIGGGALGGLIVGGSVKMLGVDAFNLLLGHSPGDITGAPEGLLLGSAVGFGAWLSSHRALSTLRRKGLAAAITGAIGGIVILLLGGKLMGGSLDLLSRNFPGSRMQLCHLGRIFGEASFGPVTQLVTGALEGALFSGCIVTAISLARRAQAA